MFETIVVLFVGFSVLSVLYICDLLHGVEESMKNIACAIHRLEEKLK